MAETLTPNYGWTKPDPGASANTWGATLNATTDKIDAQVKVNELAITAGVVPIGMGGLWFTETPPTNFIFAQGQSLSTTTYAKLFAVYQYKFGGSGASFNMPNLTQRFPLGGPTNPAGSTGGSFSVTLATANLPAHAHPITDVTHSHGATQVAHVHPDPGHTHTASEAPHSHTVNGQVLTPLGGVNVAAGPNWQFAPANSVGTSSAQPAITVNGAITGLQAAQPAITVAASGTGLSTTQNAGGGAAVSVIPPFLAVEFAIRYQ